VTRDDPAANHLPHRTHRPSPRTSLCPPRIVRNYEFKGEKRKYGADAGGSSCAPAGRQARARGSSAMKAGAGRKWWIATSPAAAPPRGSRGDGIVKAEEKILSFLGGKYRAVDVVRGNERRRKTGTA